MLSAGRSTYLARIFFIIETTTAGRLISIVRRQNPQVRQGDSVGYSNSRFCCWSPLFLSDSRQEASGNQAMTVGPGTSPSDADGAKVRLGDFSLVWIRKRMPSPRVEPSAV